jgi:hypothetical protein
MLRSFSLSHLPLRSEIVSFSLLLKLNFPTLSISDCCNCKWKIFLLPFVAKKIQKDIPRFSVYLGVTQLTASFLISVLGSGAIAVPSTPRQTGSLAMPGQHDDIITRYEQERLYLLMQL